MACKGTHITGQTYITVCGSSYNSSTIVASTVEQQYYPAKYTLWLQRLDNGVWSNVATRTEQNSGTKNFEFSVGVSRRYYRIKVLITGVYAYSPTFIH